MLDTHGFLPPFNFGGLPNDLSDPVRAGVYVLPVPYESTTTYGSGTREGPHAILQASRQVELYDIELACEPSAVGIHTLPEVEPLAGDPEGMVHRIEEICREVFDRGKLLAMLGGEHTISAGAVRAAVERFPDLTVVQLDAHADLRDTYEGTQYSHACVMRRISEIAPIVQIGIRSLSGEEAEHLDRNPGRIVYAREARAFDLSPLSGLSGPLYITIDMDVFDPSLVPGVGTPEPGGVDWYPVLDIVRTLTEVGTVVGFDVVELCPIPHQPASDFVAARLIYKLIGYITRSEQNAL